MIWLLCGIWVLTSCSTRYSHWIWFWMDTGFGEEKILNWQGVLKKHQSFKLEDIELAATNQLLNFYFFPIFRAGFFWTPPMYNGSVVVWCREDGRSRGHWDRLRQREDSIVIPTTCSDYCILPELRGKLEIKLNQPENVNFSNIYWTHFLTLIHFRTWNSRKLKVVEN